MPSTYSGAQLRERDEAVLEKHQDEINVLQNKIRRLKYSGEQMAKDIYDISHRGRRLAQSLGFPEVYDAQVAIDSSEYSLTYRECFERLQLADAQLTAEKKDMEALEAKLREAEYENKKLVKEKRDLEQRFDDMRDKKERAAELYKRDFKKWRDFKNWLSAEDKISRQFENEPGITPQERLQREKLLQRKREKAIELGLTPDPSTTRRKPAHPVDNKENDGTPTLVSKKRRLGSECSAQDSRSPARAAPLRNTLLKSVTNVIAPSASPTVFNTSSTSSTHVPLALRPIPNTIHILQEASCTPSPLDDCRLADTLNSSPPKSHRASSSDTEDDSQAITFPSTNPRTGKAVVFKVPAPPPKAGPSHQNNSLPKTPNFTLPSRPLFASNSTEQGQSRVIAEPMRTKLPLSPIEDRETGRPAKMRRITENDLNQSSIVDMSSNTSSTSRRLVTPPTKGKERELTTPLTTRTMGQKPLEDYMAFKGRGRYGKAALEPNQATINAMYTIDAAQNGGLTYQYDEVVRNKDARRKMDAGDCECCREYYQSVGPLPNRLQQPLWRSPPPTPAKPCPHHSRSNLAEDDHSSHLSSSSRSAQRYSDIDAHKKAISRHRHTWARAATPPGYWDIGFPNTQEVGDINERAKQIHKRKKDEIDREAAAEGSRYRRK